MWRETDVLRFSYLSVVWIPGLVAVLVAGTTLVSVLPLLLGWSLFLIGQNVLNDLLDQDRDMEIAATGLWMLFGVSTTFAVLLLREVWMLAAAAVVAGIVYNRWANGIPVVEAVVATIAFFLPPFLSISTDPGMLLFVFLAGVTGDLIHNLCDADHSFYHREAAVRIIQAVAVIGAGYTAALLLRNEFWLVLAPFLLFFAGTTILVSQYRTPDGKLVAVYSGILLTVYLFGVVVERGLFP